MSDLEDDLRDALHARAAEVTAADLRYADAPRLAFPTRAVDPVAGKRPPASGRRAMWGALATAACVAAGATVIAVVHATGSTTGRATPGDGKGGGPASRSDLDPGFTGNPLAGTRWRLTSLVDAQGSFAIPATFDCALDFDLDGPAEIGANDSVNHLSARYAIAGNGTLRVGATTSTAVGYAGRDRVRLAAIDGMDALMTSGTEPNAATVRTAVDGHVLTVRWGDRVLTFSRSGPVTTSSSASPTSTRPRAGGPRASRSPAPRSETARNG